MPNTNEGEIRIGVFICHCGSNIAGYLTMETLEEDAKIQPNVVYAVRNLYTCSENGINEIKKAIVEQNLNRVVVASCSPRSHEPLFRSSCEEAGLNPYLFEMINIRDQCSWVHMQEKEKGTEKARKLIRMAIAKAALLTPQPPISSDVHGTALVIGGGIAGITSALSLAARGFEVALVEKTDRLGGLLNKLNKLTPTNEDAQAIIAGKVKEVESNPKITLFTESKVTEAAGFIGKYNVDITTPQGVTKLDIGVIVVAVGGKVFVPEGKYNYDGKKVVNQLEMESILKGGLSEDVKNVVMIQCVGSRDNDRPFCAKICCQTAVKNAIEVRKSNPGARVSILFRDMQMYGVENEELFRESKMNGVRYINYAPENPPVVEEGKVTVLHQLMGEEITLDADLVVLSTPVVPQDDADDTSKLLRVPVDESGFFLEGHVKLKPLDFATDGVYLCGSARFPANVREAVAQGLGAAARASIPLAKGSILVEPIISVLSDPDACRGCGLCTALCPYGALEIKETEAGRKVHVIDVACKGCGICASTCYQHALSINSFTDAQIESQIDAFLEA